MDLPRFYLGREAAQLLRVKPATIGRWRRAGVLEAVRFGRRWLYSRAALEQALARAAVEAEGVNAR
jgi:excisionase family DNA binding protein